MLELSSATTEVEVDALFDRIGWPTTPKVVETRAALDAGYTIARELAAAKTGAPGPFDKRR